MTDMEMTNMEQQSDSVARSRVFVLIDGSFVVKWDEHQVQDLLTGQYRSFERRDFGAPITDFELNQLKQVKIVEKFDKEHVWLSPSPQRSHYYQLNAQRQRVRSYYLNTTLSGNQITQIEAELLRLGLDDEMEARERDDFVVIWDAHGRGFSSFDAAEEARTYLLNCNAELFAKTVVGFVEVTRRS